MQLSRQEILLSLLYNFHKDRCSYIICWSAVLLLLSCFLAIMESKWEQKITAMSALLCQFLTGWNLSLAKTTYMFKIHLVGCWINFLLFLKWIFFSSSPDDCVTPWIISIYHQGNYASNIFWVRRHPAMPQGTVMCSESSWDTQVVYNRWYWACVLGRAAWHLL